MSGHSQIIDYTFVEGYATNGRNSNEYNCSRVTNHRTKAVFTSSHTLLYSPPYTVHMHSNSHSENAQYTCTYRKNAAKVRRSNAMQRLFALVVVEGKQMPPNTCAYVHSTLQNAHHCTLKCKKYCCEFAHVQYVGHIVVKLNGSICL
ncbi:hypothetical protein HOLleu_23538 [Holothuria leucospilota]|uniref:Uncharacterized protein n=1 Tax=Holothuria leucospilota TaxID=206669 RepID=A0A9Q1BV02_HOLLE|nr:hypothetical protein HOLleu_23538 [Holothuria leucospilota]